ncbi:hypothetical protein EIN_250250 [Entamoeba invadens IP1]|uniref:UNC93-like protein MFSD11 n=1 Tax=Entamoeba invadens IP1 TaxID=370355 RepID=A0A0A1UEB1_ENTIV|nr:hypothetical protein EIN_250250 [Entamoeba invadens IP1]ELP94931.1 hypothetical protein EIN_250250 [Entamoeba invadens IP1]|eukprot:XP_004261702.1 hypothetical protein EIN_250250 [Entamoeba invadens IP1]
MLEKLSTVKPYLKPLYLGVCFFLLFAGYQTTQNYQSGINETDGYISVALVYGFFGIGQFVTPLVIYFLTPKYSLFFAGIFYVFYIVTNVYLIRPLYFVASAGCGLGAALIWSAAAVLLSGYEQECPKGPFCYTAFYFPYYSFFVGNFVPLIIDPSKKEMMFMVLSIIAAVAVIMFLFVQDSEPTPPESIPKVLLSTVKAFIILPLMLLFPIAVSFGVCLSYYYTTMPVLMPINMTSLIYICMGLGMIISTFCWGFLVRLFGEKWVLVIPLCCSVIAGVLGILLEEVEMNETGKNVVACLLGAISGISDSGIDSLITAFVNRVWPKEIAPLCAWRIVYLLSMCIALLYSAFISRTIVIGIEIGLAVIALFSIFIVIFLYKRVFQRVEDENNEKVKELEESDKEKRSEQVQEKEATEGKSTSTDKEMSIEKPESDQNESKSSMSSEDLTTMIANEDLRSQGLIDL